MAWTWRYRSADGEPVVSESGMTASQEFPTRSDAESWIGETWQELRADGIDAVVLYEDDHDVYGPMSLHPAQ